jgi:hypothetical protein
MKLWLPIALLACTANFGLSQTSTPTPAPQQPGAANYSIMLVNPAGGGDIVLMHTPQNQLELVDANQMPKALSGGYVPVRAAELAELIESFKGEIARLSDENNRLKAELQKTSLAAHPSLLTPQEQQNLRSSTPGSQSPTVAEIELQQRAQADTAEATRRAQVLQAWGLMLASHPATQNFNVNLHVANCNQNPALCVR